MNNILWFLDVSVTAYVHKIIQRGMQVTLNIFWEINIC